MHNCHDACILCVLSELHMWPYSLRELSNYSQTCAKTVTVHTQLAADPDVFRNMYDALLLLLVSDVRDSSINDRTLTVKRSFPR